MKEETLFADREEIDVGPHLCFLLVGLLPLTRLDRIILRFYICIKKKEKKRKKIEDKGIMKIEKRE